MDLSKKEINYICIEAFVILSTLIYAFFAHQFAKGLKKVSLSDPNLYTNIEYNWNTVGYIGHLRDVIIAILVIFIFTLITFFCLKESWISFVITLINSIYLIFYLIFLWDPIIATFVFISCCFLSAGFAIASSNN